MQDEELFTNVNQNANKYGVLSLDKCIIAHKLSDVMSLLMEHLQIFNAITRSKN